MTKPTAKTTRTAPSIAKEPSPKRAKIDAASRGDGQGSSPSPLITWADLRPELLSHVARYVSTDTADMMNFLFCVGPKTAAIVRKTYLSGNDLYLRDCAIETPPYNSADEKRRTRILAWMEYNDWKDRCEPKEKHTLTMGIDKDLLDDFDCNDMPNTGLLIFVPNSGRGFAQKLKTRCNDAVLQQYKKFRHFAFEGFPIITGVGGTRIKPGSSPDDVRLILENAEPSKDGVVEVKFGRYIDMLFSVPRVFIGYGLDNVLQYHLEKNLMTTNGTIEGLSTYDNSGDLPNVVMASFSPDIRCFKHLLSYEEINPAARIDQTEGYQLIHMAAFMNSEPEFRQYLQLLLDDPRVDPNAFSDGGLTPLHCLCLYDNIDREEKVERVKLLLRKGADPSMKGHGEHHRTVFAALADKISDIESEEEQAPHWEIMDILENYMSELLETDRQLRESRTRTSE